MSKSSVQKEEHDDLPTEAARQSAVMEARDALEDIGARLRSSADRSDGLSETVLCLVECAAKAARASENGHASLAELRDALAAARAAVSCATFAVTEASRLQED